MRKWNLFELSEVKIIQAHLKKYEFDLDIHIGSDGMLSMEVIDSLTFQTFITLYDVSISDMVEYMKGNMMFFRATANTGKSGYSWAGDTEEV